jgi:hypothetical protein
MTIKTTGAEFIKFYSDDSAWPGEKGEVYHEDEKVLVNGDPVEDFDSIPADAVVSIAGGFLVGPDWKHGEGPSFETYFKRWRKKQSTTSFVVECGVDKRDTVMSAVRQAGGRVI